METRNLFMARCPIRHGHPVWLFVLTDEHNAHGLFLYSENSGRSHTLYGRPSGNNVTFFLREICFMRNIALETCIVNLAPADANAYKAVNYIFRELRAEDNDTFMQRALLHLREADVISLHALKICKSIMELTDTLLPQNPRGFNPSPALLEDAQPAAGTLMEFLRSPMLGPSAAYPPAEHQSPPPSSARSQRQSTSNKSGLRKPSPCSLLRSDASPPGARTLAKRTRTSKLGTSQP